MPLSQEASMLKKIPVQQLQLGMYLQSLEGSWLSHPFWKNKFVLREQADLDALLSSGVPAVWIDISLGVDVPAPSNGSSAAAVAAVPAPPAEAAAKPTAAARELPMRVSLQAEMARAAQVVNLAWRLPRILLAALALALLTEGLQFVAVERHPQWLDVGIDLAGAGLGMGLAWVTLKRFTGLGR